MRDVQMIERRREVRRIPCALLLPAAFLLALYGCGDKDAPGKGAGEHGARAGGMAVERASEQASSTGGLAAVRKNKPPKARFDVLPAQGWAGMTRFRLDASLCDDDFNLSTELFKRWDYDGDGTWDTRTSRSDRVGYTYADSGVFRPRLLVRDTGGLVDSVVGSAITVLGSCPTPDFAMVDGNPNSPTFGQSQRFWDYHGRRVVLWLAAPSK